MKIDEKLIRHVAGLARLELTDEEAKRFVLQLKEIIGAFSKLDELDVKDVECSFHPIPLKNILRDDKARKCLTQEEALSNTSHSKDGYFKGPGAV